MKSPDAIVDELVAVLGLADGLDDFGCSARDLSEPVAGLPLVALPPPELLSVVLPLVAPAGVPDVPVPLDPLLDAPVPLDPLPDAPPLCAKAPLTIAKMTKIAKSPVSFFMRLSLPWIVRKIL